MRPLPPQLGTELRHLGGGILASGSPSDSQPTSPSWDQPWQGALDQLCPAPLAGGAGLPRPRQGRAPDVLIVLQTWGNQSHGELEPVGSPSTAGVNGPPHPAPRGGRCWEQPGAGTRAGPGVRGRCPGTPGSGLPHAGEERWASEPFAPHTWLVQIQPRVTGALGRSPQPLVPGLAELPQAAEGDRAPHVPVGQQQRSVRLPVCSAMGAWIPARAGSQSSQHKLLRVTNTGPLPSQSRR